MKRVKKWLLFTTAALTAISCSNSDNSETVTLSGTIPTNTAGKTVSVVDLYTGDTTTYSIENDQFALDIPSESNIKVSVEQNGETIVSKILNSDETTTDQSIDLNGNTQFETEMVESELKKSTLTSKNNFDQLLKQILKKLSLLSFLQNKVEDKDYLVTELKDPEVSGVLVSYQAKVKPEVLDILDKYYDKLLGLIGIEDVETFIQKANLSNKVSMEVLSRFKTNSFDKSASEITAYSQIKKQLYIVNGSDKSVDIVNISNPLSPTKVKAIDITPYGSGLNSVAVSTKYLAVAVESKNPDKTQNLGSIVLFDLDGNFVATYQVGYLPDMVTFTHDESKIIVANEGESVPGSDPAGSITIITLSPTPLSIVTLGFTSFDAKVETMRSQGIRIHPSKLPSVDFEPEYITVSPDDSTAFVTLQENNAVAVINLQTQTITGIQPLGVKNHERGRPMLDQFTFKNMPKIDGSDINLGGFSGLWYAGKQSSKYTFYAVPDRGPNNDTVSDEEGTKRPFLVPDYQSQIVKFTWNEKNGELQLNKNDIIKITRKDGITPITGRNNIPIVDNIPVDKSLNTLAYDPYGADLEGIIIDQDDNTFWLCDEYRPSIYHVASNGVLIERYVPEGTGALGGQAAGFYGAETIPAVYSSRNKNRGFEAIAIDQEANIIYAFIQSPMYNPDSATSGSSSVIRILGINTSTGLPISEYVYLLENTNIRKAKVDKIGDAYFKGNGKFLVIERDSTLNDPTGKKYIFEMDLKGATNILGTSISNATTGTTLESMTAEDLKASGIQPVFKEKILNLPSLGYLASDKVEGLAMLEDGRLAIMNDNDFGIKNGFKYDPEKAPLTLGIISFDDANKLDTTAEDGGVSLKHRPVRGLYMPDAISSFTFMNEVYYVTANEGDGRDETFDVEDEIKVKKLDLDPIEFPNGAVEIEDLKVSEPDGDIDHDGKHDRLYAYGSRSFSIFDSYGNLVYDNGSDFAEMTATAFPLNFNASNDDNSLDDRSDNKGPEPEGVTIGEINGKTFAFIGLERIGGIAVYDISNPFKPCFACYVNPRDFTVDPEDGTVAGTVGDLGPEGITFIPANKSPNGKNLLVVCNEVSGTTTIYAVLTGKEVFK